MIGATVTPEMQYIDKRFCRFTQVSTTLADDIDRLITAGGSDLRFLAAVCIRLGLDFCYRAHLIAWWDWRKSQDEAEELVGEVA